MPFGLVAMCFVLAFIQRPGKTFTDSRIDLTTDPTLFLHRVGQVWSGTSDLGHVASAQFVGYLFPMGPFYALGHLVGLPTWIVERLWLGALLGIAAWGAMKLMDALFSPERGVAHAGAGVLYVLNPYVVVFASRASIALLAYAVLPWLMVAVHRGLREPRSWRGPALVALVLAISAGGVNLTVLAMMAFAPLGLIMYEVAVLRRPLSAAWSFAWRAGVAGLAASAWWIVPVYLQGRYGANFLRFTEQPSSIWSTTSVSESLRLLGYWITYLGTGYTNIQPVMSVARTYLFAPLVIIGSFGVPVLALGGLRWTRRWGYAPFFGLLLVGGLLLMYAGFPEGTFTRRTLTWAYYRFPALDFLRTTYKAGPVVAISLACLGGAAATAVVRRMRERSWPTWPAIALVLLPVLWAWPLVSGQAIDSRLAYGNVPRAWHAALSDADAAMVPGRRIMVLPGQLFGEYEWGKTWDSVAPALTKRPVIIRQGVQYADPRAAQLLTSVDDQLQQGRLVPGQLSPLLSLMGVGQVLVASDALESQSGGLDAAAVARGLRDQSQFARPAEVYGRGHAVNPSAGRGGPPLLVPDIARYNVEGGAAAGTVRVDDGERPVILEGDADGVVQLAANGELHPAQAFFYAEDLRPRELRSQLRFGASLVLTDSARRRQVAATRTRQSLGPTLGPADPIPRDAAAWQLFPPAGPAGQTVAEYPGLRRLYSPQRAGTPLFPQFRAYAALDGRLRTAWLPDPFSPPAQRYLYVALQRPVRASEIGIIPRPVARHQPIWVAISVNGGPERLARLPERLNRVRLPARVISTLRIRLVRVSSSDLFLGAGGIAELQIPGVRIREALRLPTIAARLARGVDLSHSDISILLQRTTADDPMRVGADQGAPAARSGIGMLDAEPSIRRTVELPAARRFVVGGWASVAATAPDYELDRLSGVPSVWRLDSASRFEGVPTRRAASAFDGRSSTAWVGDDVPGTARRPSRQEATATGSAATPVIAASSGGRPALWRGDLALPLPWISWRGPRPVVIRRLQLVRAGPEYAFPDAVRLITPDAPPVFTRVDPRGRIRLPRSLRTGALRIEIDHVRPPAGPAAVRLLRAVAISEIRGLPRPPAPRRRGRFATACGAVKVEDQTGGHADAQVIGTLEALNAGAPLRLRSCGRAFALRLPAGRTTLEAKPGAVMQPDHLALVSPAPKPPLPGPPAGRALDIGDGKALLSLNRAAWVVLGQSYSPGWRAWCRDGLGAEHGLGTPRPIDGFANGWLVDPSCVSARFAFAPQRVAITGYVISGAIALRLIVALLGSMLFRRRLGLPRSEAPPIVGDSPPRRRSWRATLGITVVITAVTGFLFGLPIGPLAIIPLRWNISVRRLLALATVLLAAIPILYLVRAAPDNGGFSFAFARDNLPGHWAAVVAVCCVAFACAVDALTLRRAGGDPAREKGRPGPRRLRRSSGASSR